MIDIRYVTVDEAATVSQLLEQIVSKTLVYNEIARADQFKKYTPDYLAKAMTTDPKSIVAAYDNDRMVGFVITVDQTGPIWIDWICIDESVRGQHIGENLIQFCLDEAEGRGSNKYWCDTRTENTPAINLFTKMGFERKCELKAHWYGQDFYIWEKFI